MPAIRVPLLGLLISVVAAGSSALPWDPVGTRSDVSQSAASTATPTATSAAGPGVAGQSVPSVGRWGWPLVPTPTVLERFLAPEHPWSPAHRGVDLAAAVGQAVVAPDAGVVTFGGSIAGRGVVVVGHSDGLRSTFEPVESVLETGTSVVRGQQVATVSATPGHCAPVTCLHWGVLRGETYLDPLAMVGPLRVILLPLA